MHRFAALPRARYVALIALGVLAALFPLSGAGAQSYPLPPRVNTVATTPNGLPTSNPLPNTVVTISTQLSDSSNNPLINADVLFTIASAPSGSDAAFMPKTTAALDPSTAAGRQLLASLLGATSISVKTDQSGTAKAQLNTGNATGDLTVTTSVGGAIVATTRLSVGAMASPLPPATGSGLASSANAGWYLLPAVLALAVVIGAAGVRRRHRLH